MTFLMQYMQQKQNGLLQPMKDLLIGAKLFIFT